MCAAGFWSALVLIFAYLRIYTVTLMVARENIRMKRSHGKFQNRVKFATSKI